MQLEKIQHALPKIPELVMQTLIAAIDRGDVNVGEELPSERDLAEMLGGPGFPAGVPCHFGVFGRH
jgi:GntR family transcriptional repressor for pyruvate dehydrogenase complex